MTKKKIDVLDYSSKILKALSKGVLLTVKDDEKVNTMVISWGALELNGIKYFLLLTLEKIDIQKLF